MKPIQFLMLVVMAGLFLKSIATIRGLDLGIRPDDAYLVTIDLDGLQASPEETQRVYTWATERIRGLLEQRSSGSELVALLRACPPDSAACAGTCRRRGRSATCAAVTCGSSSPAASSGSASRAGSAATELIFSFEAWRGSRVFTSAKWPPGR